MVDQPKSCVITGVGIRKGADPKSKDKVKATTTNVQMSIIFPLINSPCRVVIDFDGELFQLLYEQTKIVKA